MGRSRLSTAGLLLRHLQAGLGISGLVAVLVLLTVFVVALVPRGLSLLGTAELRHELAAQPPLQGGFLGAGTFGASVSPQPPTTDEQLFGPTDTVISTLSERLEQPLAGLLGEPEWLLRVAGQPTEPVERRSDVLPVVGLAVDLDWLARVQFVDGLAPAAWTGDESDDLLPEERAPIEIALSADAARAMDLRVGDLLDHPAARLRLSGTYEPKDSGDAYWILAPELATGTLYAGEQRAVVNSTAYLDPQSAVGLRSIFETSELSLWVPVDNERMDYADATEVLDQARAAAGLGVVLPNGEQVSFATGMGRTIETAVGRVAAATALIALAASGPLGVVLAVYALGVQSVIQRRRMAIALASARGAGQFQLRSAMLLQGIAIAVPAAALAAFAAATLLPARVSMEAQLAPVAMAFAMPILFTVMTSGNARTVRENTASSSSRKGRRMLELAVFALALLSLFLLARRGLVASSSAVGIDPLLAATPLLLAVSVCLLVLRIYPLPLHALLSRFRASSGAIGLLGAARAIRQPALGFAASLALVVGVSVTVFSVVMATTVSSAMTATAEELVGADIRIEATQLSDELLQEVGELDGVRTAVAIGVVRQVVLDPGSARQLDVTVVFADLEALRSVWPELPSGLADRRGDRIPMLASEDVASKITADAAELEGEPASLVGVPRTTLMKAMVANWVLVDRAFALDITGKEFDETRALASVEPGVDPATVALSIEKVVGDHQRPVDIESVEVFDTTTTLGETRSAPVISGLQAALLLAAIAAMLLSVLTLVLASIGAAAVRHRILGVLRTLGMSGRQVSRLVAWELGPVAITALLAGTALGLAIPWVVTGALDLTPFVGGTFRPTPWVDPLAVLGAMGVFSAVVTVSSAVAVAIARRRDPNRILRIGAE